MSSQRQQGSQLKASSLYLMVRQSSRVCLTWVPWTLRTVRFCSEAVAGIFIRAGRKLPLDTFRLLMLLMRTCIGTGIFYICKVWEDPFSTIKQVLCPRVPEVTMLSGCYAVRITAADIVGKSLYRRLRWRLARETRALSRSSRRTFLAVGNRSLRRQRVAEVYAFPPHIFAANGGQ